MGGADRFGRALDLARQAIDRASRGERVAVIAFDERADVLSQPGGASDARAALQGLSPGFGATRYSAAFAAAQNLAAGARGHLVIVTDLQRGGWEGEPPVRLPGSWEVEVQDVGAVSANVGVESIAIEPARAIATLRNSSEATRTGLVRISLDGAEIATAPYSVGPHATADVALPWRPADHGTLAVAIDDPGGLAADDTRYVALGARATSKVLLIASGRQSGLYLSQALETTSGQEDGFDAEIATGARLAEMSADQVASYPAIALLTTGGVERRAREAIVAYVNKGGGLFMIAGPDLDAGVASALTTWQPPLAIQSESAEGAESSAALTLAATDLRHPIFRPFGPLAANLGQVRFDRAWRVAPNGWSIVGRFSNASPALLERSLGQGRVVLFASDVDRKWNDFPLHPAFVPFALETIRHVAGSGNRRPTRDYTVGQAPTGVPAAPGVYRTPEGRTVSINVDPREGGLDRVSRDGFVEMVQRSAESAAGTADVQARQTESRQNYWQYGLIVMIAALVAESFVGRA